MNNGSESLYLPDDAAVQKARKDGYRKERTNRRVLDESVMQEALWESVTYREFAGNIRQESSEAGEKIE
jgi:hypothetical protein